MDDYNRLAKQELIPAKQDKAYERVKTFRAELTDYRQNFERLKHEAEEQVSLSGFTPCTASPRPDTSP